MVLGKRGRSVKKGRAILLEKNRRAVEYTIMRGQADSLRMTLWPRCGFAIGDQVRQYLLPDGTVLLERVKRAPDVIDKKA